jgi:hypothetical protein
MADWNVFGNGKKWKVLNRGVSASGRNSPVFLSSVSASEKLVLHSGVSASSKINSAAQRCFGIVKNQSVLHSGVSTS